MRKLVLAEFCHRFNPLMECNGVSVVSHVRRSNSVQAVRCGVLTGTRCTWRSIRCMAQTPRCVDMVYVRIYRLRVPGRLPEPISCFFNTSLIKKSKRTCNSSSYNLSDTMA